MSEGNQWGRILADSTLNRLVNRLNRRLPSMGEADLEYIVLEFEKANRIQLDKLKGKTTMNECKIDSHVPTDDGQACTCGYFGRQEPK